jgi:hypothetical protein
LTGGVIFGGWTGANTPHSNGGTFSAGFAVAREYNVGNRWADFGFQTDDGSRATKGVTSGPDVVPTKDEDPGKTVTFTGGTPGVVTHAEHGMVKGTSVKFTTSDALPTGISAGAVYYIDPIDADSYYLIDGRRQAASHKDFTGGGMGTHKAFPQWPGTFAFQVIGSVAGHQWWTGYHIRPGKIKHGGVGALWWGGIATDDDQPLYALDLRGYWQNVFNLKSAIFSGKIFDLNSAQRTQIAVDLKIGAVETTSTALASASDAINTAGKFSGKLALAIDTGVVYVALGSSATANWRPFTMGTGLTPA